MPVTILTKKFAFRTYRLPLTPDESAFLRVKPLTADTMHRITANAIAESGFDMDIASAKIIRAALTECVAGWEGLEDVNGDPIPFSQEALEDICEADPRFAESQYERIRRVAREARLEEEKN